MKPAPRRKTDPRHEALLRDAYIHLGCRRHNTFTLASAMGVSPATAFRLVKVLRSRGHRIVSMKEGAQWFFEVRDADDSLWKNDPLVKAAGFIRGVRRPRGESVDDVVYRRK